MRKVREYFFVAGIIFSIIFGILYLPFTQYRIFQFLTLEQRLHPAEAIVVLGGGLKSDGSLGKSTEERIRYGIFLYEIGFARYLILSGGDVVKGSVEAEKMCELALGSGIPRKAIMEESHSLNTYENALYVKKILKEYNIKGKLILVTSPYHMRRAFDCFKKQGLEVLPAPVRNSEIYKFGFYQNLRNLHLILHEFLAFALYRCNGWI